MKKSILFLASAALLFAGCAKVEDEAPIPENGKRVVTLKATVNEADTRVSVESDGTYQWQSGDKIGVWVVDTDGGATYPYTTEDSGTTANFEVSLEVGQAIGEYAFYPFSEDHFVSGEGPRFAMDANLTYVEGATNMPMLGTISSDGTIAFKSVGGVIKLTVNNIPSNAAHLLFSAKDTDNENLVISGVFPVSGDVITAGGIMGVNSVNIDFTNKWQSSMVFYVPLPTGTYGGFELEFDNASSSETLASKKVSFGSTGLTVERNQIIVAPALDLGNTPTQLIPDGVYAIALMGESHLNKDIMMTANTGSGSFQVYSTLGTTYTTEGKLSIPAASAWRISYEAESSTYSIQSMSTEQYLSGNAGNTNLTLNTATNKAQFSITDQGLEGDNSVYHISVHSTSNERWIGFNYNGGTNPRFALYNNDGTYKGLVRIIPATANDQTPSLSFSSTTTTVTATAPSAVFYYTAEHLTADPTVVVTTDDDHIVSSATVNTTNKQIVVNLNPNTESSEKTATLTVSCEGVNDIVLTVNQDGKSDVVEDVITKAFTEISITSYSEWKGKQGTSGAVYAGYSAGTNNSVQLKSDDNISGIVSTTSGGKIKIITVTWEAHTQTGRTLNVYGKNNAYNSAADLYNTSKQGTLLGTIVMGTSTTITVSGDYEYIGLRSASGAMYLSEIRIGWESGSGPDPTTPTMQVSPDNGSSLSWDDSEFGNETAKYITVLLNDAATGYNVSYSDPDNLWAVNDDENGTITVYPKAANTSTTDDKELSITITHKDQSSLSATVSLIQSKKIDGVVTDIITAAKLSASNNTYTSFSDVSDKSKAKYAGNSAQDSSGNIQLRSNNSNSGIVSTVSGGKVKSIKITVASGDKTIDVYGNNNAYNSASDLYATSGNTNQGTKIGSLSSTGTITVTGDYEYIGIRSNSGAVYISSIEINWE